MEIEPNAIQAPIFLKEDFEATPEALRDYLVYPKSWDEETVRQFRFALEYARRAHAGSFRKGTHIPYIAHPVEASLIAMTITDDIEVAEAALLHDVVEDTDHTIEDIRAMFGEQVAEYVLIESEDKRPNLPPDETWKIRKSEFLNHLKIASFPAKAVALSDKLSNLRAIAREYLELGDTLWCKFNQKDKAEQAWYYRSVKNLLEDLSKTDAYRELVSLYALVFSDTDKSDIDTSGTEKSDLKEEGV